MIDPQLNAQPEDAGSAADPRQASIRRRRAGPVTQRAPHHFVVLHPHDRAAHRILDDLGLRAALEWQAEELARRIGVPCELAAEIGDLQLERELATTVFRIFQEALTNVARHASATRVDVHLWLERGHLRLDLADDGIGVPEIAPRSATLGLLGMRERARRCGGECTVRRRDPRGTIVALSVPLRFPSERDQLGA